MNTTTNRCGFLKSLASLAAAPLIFSGFGSVPSARLRMSALLPMLSIGCLTVQAFGATPPAMQTAVLAGGCFWAMEDVFQHVKGVTAVTAGYSGGAANTANYETVSSGTTGHAESIKISYDPAQVTYGQLLDVYFRVAHDPTELNRQGPDSGTQYRSEIFYATPEQEKTAQDKIARLDAAKAFPLPIVTKLEPLQSFYPAEAYHQNYAALHPDNPYIFINDTPKVVDLEKQFAGLYTDK